MFYQNLQNIMKEMNLTSYQVAKKCGLKVQVVDNIIKNKVEKPQRKTVDSLVTGLGISESALINKSDEENINILYSCLSEDKRKLVRELILALL